MIKDHGNKCLESNKEELHWRVHVVVVASYYSTLEEKPSKVRLREVSRRCDSIIWEFANSSRWRSSSSSAFDMIDPFKDYIVSSILLDAGSRKRG